MDVSIEVVPQSVPPSPGDGINQLVFGDPLSIVDVTQFVYYDDNAEVDFYAARGRPFATHEAILAGDCDEAHNLLAWTTHAIGVILKLRLPYRPDPDEYTLFWDLEQTCDAHNGILEPPITPGVLDFESGLSVDCKSAIIGRAPYEVTCEADPARFKPDPFWSGFDSVEWDFGDGDSFATPVGEDFTYTFEDQSGAVEILASGRSGDESCAPLRGYGNYILTVCPKLDAVLEVEHAKTGTSINNVADPGPAGCSTTSSWVVYEGEREGGEVVARSTAVSPQLDLSPGTYTAVVEVMDADGRTDEPVTSSITFTVPGCGCQTAPSSAGFAWTIGLLLLGWRRSRRSQGIT